MKSEFAAKQPKHGDKVIHCGHLDCDEHYFWYWPKAAKFQRPDGTIVEADWLIACERCFQRTEGHASRFRCGAMPPGKGMSLLCASPTYSDYYS